MSDAVNITPGQMMRIYEMHAHPGNGKLTRVRKHEEIYGWLVVTFSGPRHPAKTYTLDIAGEHVADPSS